VVVVIIAFVAGILVGVAGDHLLFIHHLFPRGFVAGRIVERLDRELHLTPQQKTQVQQILDRHRARIDAITSSVRPQVRQEIDTTNAEIEKILTPEQRAQFAKMRMRMPGRRGMGGPPPPQ
jgi:Spy/CpxP family protein refolding chaperone